VADITTLQVSTGDVTNITVSNSDVTSVSVRNGDVTTLVATPATITLERILTMSNAAPLDITRTANSGVLEIASRADHVHSIANTLLDGGNY
jgi:hypothetical protein